LTGRKTLRLGVSEVARLSEPKGERGMERGRRFFHRPSKRRAREVIRPRRAWDLDPD
jgi:hypothetical protein